jgi:subfamily B ATP-binding cassette protein MsbA
MGNIGTVFRFGGHYLRRYWTRLAAGIVFGILFGLTSASFMLATKEVVNRMTPAVAVAAAAPETTSTNLSSTNAAPAGFTARFKAGAAAFKVRAETAADQLVDPWLPKSGRDIDWRQFLGGLLFLPLLAGMRGFCGYLSSYCMAWVSEHVVNDLRGDVLEKMSSLSLDYFNRSTTGDMLTRVSGDTGQLQKCLTLSGDLVKEPVTLAGIFLGLCLLDWQLTLMAMVFVPLCVLPVIVLGRKVRKASNRGWDSSINQSSLLVEVLSGIRVVKAFGLESMLVRRFREISKRILHFRMKTVQAGEQMNPIIETVSMLGMGLLILYIIHKQLQLGDVVGYFTGMIFFYTSIKKLAGMHVMFQQTRIGVERLASIMTEQPSIKEDPQARPVTGFHSALRFENVTFAYGSIPVLQDIGLEIKCGQKLGVAGESGSGKSTLVNLVLRFYDPTAGSIQIDGLDLRQARIGDVRSQMALVSQEIVLFNETVADNIAYGKPGATRAEIETAAKAAFAHDFILQLPKGYETFIGEKGVTLSGGQRQRLAIARAFVRNAPLLVLDEATASLDSQAEAEVQAAIDRLEENRTVICVAHRLSTLTKMDRIIVLTAGRIVEQGTFNELLRQNGVFAAMARKQGIDTRGR